MKARLFRLFLGVLLVLVGSLPRFSGAAPSPFTYQGRLLDQNQPASGDYDLRFRLVDAATNGNYVGPTLTNTPVAVSNGLFYVALDFGDGVFNGEPLWIEIGVRTNLDVRDYTLLIPRQPLTATPYALFATTATTAAVSTNLVRAGSTLTTVSTNTEVILNVWDGTVWRTERINLTNLTADLAKKTNTTLFAGTGGAKLQWLPGAGYQMLSLSQSNSADYLYLRFAGGAAGGEDGADIFLFPNHAESISELVLVASGSIAWGTGRKNSVAFGNLQNPAGRAYQEGIGGEAREFKYEQSEIWGMFASNTNLGCGVMEFYKAHAWSNGVRRLVSSPKGTWDFPARSFSAGDTNGVTGLWTLWDWFDPACSDGLFYDGGRERLQIITSKAADGGGGGLAFKGKLVQEKKNFTCTNNAPLDFNSAQALDITAGSSTMSVYTTNEIAGTTNFEQRVAILHTGGHGVAWNWPAGWNHLSTLPASNGPGEFVYLSINSTGIGETNKFVTAVTNADTTFVFGQAPR